MIKRIIILILIFFPKTIYAQINISGDVVDADNVALDGVIVQSKDQITKKMANFTKTDDKGHFSIKVSSGQYLEFSLLGFKKEVVDNLSKTIVHIVMHEDNIVLKEVNVKADKVRQHGDTLNYTVGAFANKNDRSIGDVLARIPGFDVDKVSGSVSYEGKPISKFYIEGIDMLGQKYGVATNTIPQVDVGTVEVMRNHQPIKVLEDFTFTEDAAVNIKMKDSAKSHWITSINGGVGKKDDGMLWNFEGLGLRLKSDFQTMMTYKTNNNGVDISRESTNLFNFDNFGKELNDFISLSAPLTSVLPTSRSLENRSHTFTYNVMKRVNASSQFNLQAVYSNFRDVSFGNMKTEYYLQEGDRVINNTKSWLDKQNELYTLLKYEHNSDNSYLKNSISGDFFWDKQRLIETGTNPNMQNAKVPKFEMKDMLYIIRKYGNRLISFYSNNIIQSHPQELTVDSIWQNVNQQYIATDTYAMGGLNLGKFNLSMTVGVNAMLRYIKTSSSDLLNQHGNFDGKTHFGYTMVYINPKFVYQLFGLEFQAESQTQYIYNKYSLDNGIWKFYVSPTLSIKWKATPRLTFALRGSMSVDPLDFNRFYNSFIIQDYLYINKGYIGYRVSDNKTIRLNTMYNDPLHGLHTIFSVSRNYGSNPYTSSREFLDDYIIQSFTDMETKHQSWTVNLIADKGFDLLHSKLSLRAIYLHDNSKMLQNTKLLACMSNNLNINGNLNFSLWKDMTIDYAVRYSYNSMRFQSLNTKSEFSSWSHRTNVVIPINAFKITLSEEYNHNQISTNKYKDIFFSDIDLGLKTKKFEYGLKLSNIFNKHIYAYSVNSNMMSITNVNEIRGRELMFSIYCRL